MKVSGEEDRSLCSLKPVEIRGSLLVDFTQCEICQGSYSNFISLFPQAVRTGFTDTSAVKGSGFLVSPQQEGSVTIQ